MSTHTPGPWTYGPDEKGDGVVSAPDYGPICYPLDDNYDANGALIAAAPDLAAALQAILDAHDIEDDSRYPAIDDAVDAAHEALQKAGIR